MGISGIGTWELVVILLIAMLLFGTSRLRTLGGDLGEAIKSFREAMSDSRPQTPHTKAVRAAVPVEPNAPSSASPENIQPPKAGSAS